MNRIDSNYTNCRGNSMESPTSKNVLYHIHLLKCHHYIILIHQELVQPSPARLGPPPSTSSRRAVFRRSSSLCCCDRSVSSCNPAVNMLMSWPDESMFILTKWLVIKERVNIAMKCNEYLVLLVITYLKRWVKMGNLLEMKHKWDGTLVHIHHSTVVIQVGEDWLTKWPCAELWSFCEDRMPKETGSTRKKHMKKLHIHQQYEETKHAN